MKRMHLALALLLSLVCSSAFAQKTFVLVSFNALHYGWGGQQRTDAKNKAIFEAAKALSADVIVIQEVMPDADFKGLEKLFPPGVVTMIISKKSFGQSKYRERYLILLGDSKFPKIGRTLEFSDLQGKAFSRPPMFVEVQPYGSKKWYYIGDFHAIWGRSQSQRTEEAGAICSVLLATKKLPSTDVALAGDWNLDVAKLTQSAGCMTGAGPDSLTTLNRNGSRYSSSYDHGVTFVNSDLQILKSRIYDPPDTVAWRRNVSDHVPVAVEYRYR